MCRRDVSAVLQRLPPLRTALAGSAPFICPRLLPHDQIDHYRL